MPLHAAPLQRASSCAAPRCTLRLAPRRRPRCAAPRAAAAAAAFPPLPPASCAALREFDASDFELVRRLGQLAFRSVEVVAPTLSWTVREDAEDAAPDALRVAPPPRLAGLAGALRGGGAAGGATDGAADGDNDDVAPPQDAGYAGGVPPVAAVTLYAARYISGPGCAPPARRALTSPRADATRLSVRSGNPRWCC
jgi:hypothetical protein